MVLLVLVVYVADSFAIWMTFGWFVAPLRYTAVLAIRGATYLLALLNYTLGQGAIVYFVHRSRGVPVQRGAAAVLLIMGINLLLLLFLATLGLGLGADALPALKTLLAVAYGGLLFYIIMVVTKPKWLARRPVFEVLLSAGLTGHLKSLAVRAPHLVSLIAYSYISLRAFNVNVPLAQAVMYLPVVFFIAVLPISVQGLGTTQATMLFLFARYADGDPASQQASVLAASLGSQGVALGVQLFLGLICLRSQIARDLRGYKPEPAASPQGA